MIWYHVSFDENTVFLDVNPPGGKGWKDQIHWNDIIRVCFLVGDLWESDEIYVFTNKRPESYVIPTEANGGPEFWDEIIHRKLFDAELAIKIASATEGLYCWPDDQQKIYKTTKDFI